MIIRKIQMEELGILERLVQLLEKHNLTYFLKGDYIVNYGSGYGFIKQTVPKDWYFPARRATFEGKLYMIPNKAEALLEHIYGSSYMQLPPPEKRRAHFAEQIQFEDGEIFRNNQ